MAISRVFVAGATGTVGGAVARNLLKHDISVQALARNPDSISAQEMRRLGVKLVAGNYDDESALTEALNGCDGVLLNLSPDFFDHQWERKVAQKIMTTAKNSGVKHFIYSGGLATVEPEKLENWDAKSFVATVLLSKQAIENEVRQAGFESWTILRPGSFMANYILPLVAVYPDLVRNNRFVTAFTREQPQPLVDPNDIGKFAVAAYLEPQRFHAKEIEIAGERLTIDETMQKLSKATGRNFEVVYLSNEEIMAQKDTNPFIAGQFISRGYENLVKLEEVKAWGIPLGTFDQFLERESGRVKETYGSPP
jgi:uncharacterized protein YbjT (DUF2867 family)